jgi:hypothetical protein
MVLIFTPAKAGDFNSPLSNQPEKIRCYGCKGDKNEEKI